MDFNLAYSYVNNTLNSNKELEKYYQKIINYKKESFIPALDYESALFLKFIVKIKKPLNILEIGFGSGISSLFMRKGLNNFDNFISLERDTYRYNRGIELLQFTNINDIQLININAFEYFKKTSIKFDLVFLDAVKREYKDYIDPVTKILNTEALFICDNILFSGRVFEENIDNKYKKGTDLLKEFIEEIKNSPEYETIFLLNGDGLSISIHK